MRSLHDELVFALREDDSIREPRRISKLVIDLIRPFLDNQICSEEDASEVFAGIYDGSYKDYEKAYKMLLLKTENRFG